MGILVLCISLVPSLIVLWNLVGLWHGIQSMDSPPLNLRPMGTTWLGAQCALGGLIVCVPLAWLGRLYAAARRSETGAALASLGISLSWFPLPLTIFGLAAVVWLTGSSFGS